MFGHALAGCIDYGRKGYFISPYLVSLYNYKIYKISKTILKNLVQYFCIFINTKKVLTSALEYGKTNTLAKEK